jgi:hypothetical protein
MKCRFCISQSEGFFYLEFSFRPSLMKVPSRHHRAANVISPLQHKKGIRYKYMEDFNEIDF